MQESFIVVSSQTLEFHFLHSTPLFIKLKSRTFQPSGLCQQLWLAQQVNLQCLCPCLHSTSTPTRANTLFWYCRGTHATTAVGAYQTVLLQAQTHMRTHVVMTHTMALHMPTPPSLHPLHGFETQSPEPSQIQPSSNLTCA